jgi:TnpA family transposase
MVSFHMEVPMPVQLFTEAERARRNRFPDVIAYEDLVTFFTLSERDLGSIPRSRDPHNRLGYALQLCTLRFMGFGPDALSSAPPDAVAFVAHQLAVAPSVLAAYGARAQTRQDHLLAVQAHLGYRKVGQDDVYTLADWLLERALEHDKPTLLYELAGEKLRTAQLGRPGVTRLERLVAETRERAQEETFRQLTPSLTDECRRCLDTLLEPDPVRGMTPLAWLRRPAVSNSPKAIVGNLEKLTFLRATGVEAWSLAALNPNRLTFLAQLARKSSAQALQRSPAVRCYPLLMAFLVHCLATVTDEVIEMFDRCLADAYARAGKDLEDFRKAMAQATNEKVHLFRELARAVLDPAIADPHLRPAIYTRLTPAVLRRAADEADQLVRPLDDSYFDFFETR